MQVYIGKNITQPNDPLTPMPVAQLMACIKKPKPELQQFIQQLRSLQSIDPQQYKKLKTRLPYFTCGHFYPALRRKENFTAIELFVADIDHLSGHDADPHSLRNKFITDNRVLACFISPGGDGLKIIFRLSSPCKDSALFSAFYKTFIAAFGSDYALTGMLDLHTCDVTRACFVSFDPLAHFSPQAQPIKLTDYINPDEFSQSETIIKQAEERLQQLKAPQAENSQLNDEILQKIKQKLNPSFRAVKTRQYYLPPEVEHVLPLLTSRLRDYEIEITQTEPINYGRKIRVKAGNHWAELNIFYGKRGFSIVKTPKTGSNLQLADMAHQIISELLLNTYPGNA